MADDDFDLIERPASEPAARPAGDELAERQPAPEQRQEAPSQERQGDDIEARARAQGWVDKDSYRGPPDKWRSAEEFVRRGEEELPVLRERLKSSDRRYAEIEARLARQEREFADRAERLNRMSEIALRRQREQIEANYEAAKYRAVESGDTAEYHRLSQGQREAIAAYDKEIAEKAPQPSAQHNGQVDLPPEIEVEVNGWKAANPWFDADPEMNQVAQLRHMQLMREKPGLALRDNLAEVTRYMRKRYPEKFEAPEPRATAVESGSRSPSGVPRKRGWADLPPEAKAAGRRDIADKLFKDEADFAADYFSQPGV